MLRAGAERVIERMTARAPKQARIDVHSISADFHLDAADSRTLFSALLAGGLLYPDGTGGCRPTERFRDYACACVVVPLSRDRAKALIDSVSELAQRINVAWAQNPYQIKMIAVSGGYMSRCKTLHELSLWPVLRRRPEVRARGWKPALGKDDAQGQIRSAMNALSSFIVVRIVADRQAIERPFSVVFQASEPMVERPLPAWDKVCDWSASITRRITSPR